MEGTFQRNFGISVTEIYQRHRHQIEDLWPEIFDVFKQKSIVCITGPSASGKSLLCLELMSRMLDASEKAEVLLVDVDRNFNILKFNEIIQKFGDEDLVEQKLPRFSSTSCSQLSLSTLTDQLLTILGDNCEISLVVIDSFGSNFYLAMSSKQTTNKNSYIADFAEHLKSLAIRFNVSFVYSVPGFLEPVRPSLDLNTYSIKLKKGSDGIFAMRVATNDKFQQFQFMVDNRGICSVEVNSQVDEEGNDSGSESEEEDSDS